MVSHGKGKVIGDPQGLLEKILSNLLVLIKDTGLHTIFLEGSREAFFSEPPILVQDE